MRGHRLEWVAAAFVAASGFVWVVWALARGTLTTFDESLRSSLHGFSSPSVTLLMQSVTFLGSQAAVLGITACSAFTLFRIGRRDSGKLILIVMGGAELLQFVLKVQFHRQRPEPFFDTVLPGTYSFPSGHAMLSLCLFGVLSWVIGAQLVVAARWLIRIAAAALILTIGVSRVYLGVHHPTDVIGGYLVAMAWIAALRAIRGRVSNMDT